MPTMGLINVQTVHELALQIQGCQGGSQQSHEIGWGRGDAIYLSSHQWGAGNFIISLYCYIFHEI